MPQRAKKREAIGKPKRRHKSQRVRASPHPKHAATHAAPTVQIINSPDGNTSLKPQIRRKRDGRTMPMDLGKQYRGLKPRKGMWKGKHPQRGVKTLERHKKSILWNLGKGSPGAQQWVLDHIPRLNPADDVKETGKEVLIGLGAFLGSRIASNMVGKLPILSRMGPAGPMLTSAGVVGLTYLAGRKWPHLRKPLLVGGAIGLLDSVIKNLIVPHVPSIGGVLGDAEPLLPAPPKETLALPPHGVGDDADDTAAGDDAADLHARSVRGHRMMGYDDEADDNVHARALRAHRLLGDDEAEELAELRERVRLQRGMGFDVRPALAGCGCPPEAFGDDGMGFDVHPAMADYAGGMGFDVHPAMADYDNGMGFDVHPAIAGVGEAAGSMSDDGMAMADSGDGLGRPVDEGQSGSEEMGHYISTGAVDEGQGAYVPSGAGSYVPSGTGAYVPSAGMGAYVPMSGVDAEEVAAMIFGGPWALARLNHLRRHRRRPHHHSHHLARSRGRWHFDPALRQWRHYPLGDADGEGQEYTADDIRQQRGVMGIDDAHFGGRYANHRPHSHVGRHHYQHGQHQQRQPMHLECDFYLPNYAGYRQHSHRPHPHAAHPIRREGPAHHAAQNWHPMTGPPSMPRLQAAAPQSVTPMQIAQMKGPTMAGVQSQPAGHSQGFAASSANNAGGIFGSD